MIKKNGWIGTDDEKTAVKRSGSCVYISTKRIASDEYDTIVVDIEELKLLLKEI